MSPEDVAFLRSFYQAVVDRPIMFNGKDDHLYVPLYEDPAFTELDPVKLLARTIELSPGQSVQLLSGQRGVGKTTELYRLRQRLVAKGFKVVLVDMEDHLNLAQPVNERSFLLALIKAFVDALSKEGHLGEISAEVYHTALEGLSRLSDVLSLEYPKDLHQYAASRVRDVRERYGPDTEIVLLVDSMDHVRGTAMDGAVAVESLLNLFVRHSDMLHFDQMHVVYAVPAYLKALYPHLDTLYAPGGIQVLPVMKVRERQTQQPFRPGLASLERMLEARGSWRVLLGPERDRLEELLLLSGGHVRSLLRLFAELIRRADRLPVTRTSIDAAITQVRSEFLPIASDDASWLEDVSRTHEVVLTQGASRHDLARYLETYLVLTYLNGGEWHDIHPLVRDAVRMQASMAEARRSQSVLAYPRAPSMAAAVGATGAELHHLELRGIQSAPDVRLEWAPRLNLLAGDNSTGKTLVLDVLWWALTGTWAGAQVWPGEVVGAERPAPAIVVGAPEATDVASHFDASREQWSRPPQWPAIRSLVLYARVDGSCSVWDPIRNKVPDSRERMEIPRSYAFTPEALWEGLEAPDRTVLCNGLVRDWTDWQHRRTDLFELLKRVLHILSLPDERLEPGSPRRVSMHTALDVPTLELSYGTVPVIYASAAVKRIIGLAYLLVWAWHEHRTAARLSGLPLADRIILLIDEVESHLHPKWQRRILPALLQAVEGLSESRPVQLVASTHAPLVLASLEPHFDVERDKVFRFELEKGRILVHELPWAKQGDVVDWLVSEAFGLRQARSQEAEEAIEAAEAFMRGEPVPGLETREKIEARLRQVLAGDDTFWPRWLVGTGVIR